ncbi:MAG TPA: peptidylprolyl isomerase [Blastocatellia bacterium]|nr:peptidylprolyl isomerase [Blastocatellia bacterium]
MSHCMGCISRERRAGLLAGLLIVALYSAGLSYAGPENGAGFQEADSTDYSNLEAVIDTSRGQIVIEFFPQDAPRHVEYFIKKAREGAYDGTTFHRVVKYALIQGGDPLSKNPSARSRYGTGGLNAGLPDEVNKNKHITGAVSAALQLDRANPNEVRPGTSGMQFFIVLNAGSAQANLDSKFTVFGRAVEGLDVVSDISAAPANQSTGLVNERIEIKKITVREKTPTLEQMKAMQATIETSLGTMKLQLMPEAAPNTTRAFVRFARAGMYDGTTFFRVSQKYYLEAGYLDAWPQDSPNRKRFFSLWPTPFEKNDVKQVRGTVSMRQVQDGITSYYFFIISQDNPALDGKHVPFAKVVEGLDVVDKIAGVEVDKDQPKQRIEIKKITIQ